LIIFVNIIKENLKMKTILMSIFFIVLIGCASDSQSDLIDLIKVGKVTYTTDVKKVIDDNCIVCHNSGLNPIAPFPLETYNQVRGKAENGPLLTRIQLPAGDPSIMPKTGKMPQQLIDIIVAWADQGFIE